MSFLLEIKGKFSVVKIITLSKTAVKVHKVFFKVQQVEKRLKYAILMLYQQ